jgi:hypothetical protein
MDPAMPSPAPIACHLDAIPAPARPRYFTLRAQVLATLQAVAEIGDGFALELGIAHDGLVALAEWIAFERLCCPFLTFRLTIEGDGPLRLELGGAEGVKDFLRGEIAEIGGAKLLAPTSLLRAR